MADKPPAPPRAPAIERRVKKLEGEMVQMRDRTHSFAQALQILTGTVETNTLKVSQLEGKVEEVQKTAATAIDQNDQIIALIQRTKGAAGFVYKHGGRIIAFVVGILVASGRLPKEVNDFVAGFFPS